MRQGLHIVSQGFTMRDCTMPTTYTKNQGYLAIEREASAIALTDIVKTSNRITKIETESL